MKRFFGFVRKEFIHIFRDPRTMLILFGIPIIQIILFGYVITNEIKDVKVAIYDKSNDRYTREITNKILSSGYFILGKYIETPSEIESMFRTGDIKEVIIFEPDFAGRLMRENTASIQLLADASDANTAGLVLNYTSGIIQDYITKHNKNATIPYTIRPQEIMLFNRELKGAFMFVPGTMALILLLISAMMTSISIAREKEFGTMETILVSPLKPLQIILGKVTPYIGLSFINAIVIIVLGNLIFKLPIQGSILLLLFESLIFILLALSLGILISTVSNSQQTAMFISAFALMMPTMLLSGFIFPIENMPNILQFISFFMPARWFIVIIKNIMLKGTGILYVWKETFILVGFITFFLFLSIRKFKIRLE